MSDALSSAELTECPVELLPARTVLSLFAQGIGGGLLGGSGGGSGGGKGGGGGSPFALFQSLFGLGGKGTAGPNGTATNGGDGAVLS
jgi:hypothetical protein